MSPFSAFVLPSESEIPVVKAVSSWPTCACPAIVGAPVELPTAATAAVAALVSGPSELPASSTKVTLTLRDLPTSSATGVYVFDVAPAMSLSAPPSTRTHW